MRMTVILLVFATAAAAAAQDSPPLLSVPHAEGIVEEVGTRFPPPLEEAAGAHAGPASWSQSFLRAGATGIQLRLENIAFSPDEFFEIEIVDDNGAVVQTLTNETLEGTDALWTDIGRGQSLGIAVYGNRDGSLRFDIAAISFDRLAMVLESVIGPDEREHLYRYEGGLLPVVERVRGPVAKLSFIKDSPNGPRRLVCTGFLVDDDTLVTNQHCVADQETCDATKVIFGFEYNRIGQTPGMEQYDCRSVLAQDFDLDLSVLRLEGDPGRRWGTLELSAADVVGDERLFVLQHPAGEAKQISDAGCIVFEPVSPGRTTATDFAHQCDTLGGSSGSPVFNVSGEVVGLHHWGRAGFGRYAGANRAVRIGPVRELLAGLGVPRPGDDGGAGEGDGDAVSTDH